MYEKIGDTNSTISTIPSRSETFGLQAPGHRLGAPATASHGHGRSAGSVEERKPSVAPSCLDEMIPHQFSAKCESGSSQNSPQPVVTTPRLARTATRQP